LTHRTIRGKRKGGGGKWRVLVKGKKWLRWAVKANRKGTESRAVVRGAEKGERKGLDNRSRKTRGKEKKTTPPTNGGEKDSGEKREKGFACSAEKGGSASSHRRGGRIRLLHADKGGKGEGEYCSLQLVMGNLISLKLKNEKG